MLTASRPGLKNQCLRGSKMDGLAEIMQETMESMETIEPVVESVDLTPILESLTALQELMTVNQELLIFAVLALLILSGVVMGCMISLILAVTFK